MNKIFSYTEPSENGHNTVIISEEQIIKDFYPKWAEKMKSLGRNNLISKENCIKDFCVVHYCHQLKF